MAALYKLTEWESTGSGLWYCNDVSNLTGGSGNWWNAARACNLTPAAFIEMLLKDFKPDIFSYNSEKNIAIWAWKDKDAQRKFKNYINKQARINNFVI